MNSKALFLIACFSLCSFFPLTAQQSRVDSLKPLLAQRSDTSRIRFLLLMSDAYLSFAAKKAIEPAAEARILAVQAGDERKEAKSLFTLGKAYARTGSMNEAIGCFNQSIVLMKTTGTDEEVAELLINEGNAYNDAGLYDQALTTSLEAYKVYEKVGDKRGMARSLIVSGNAYRLTNNATKAVVDYEKSQSICKDIKDEQLQASCLNNLSIVYGDKGDHQEALNCLFQAKAIHEKSSNAYQLSKVLNNIGGEYLQLGEYEKSTEYYLQALDIRKSIGDMRGQASSLSNLGSVSMAQEHDDKAVEYYSRALEIAKGIGALDLQMNIYNSLHEAYVRKKDIEKALQYYKHYTSLKDSIYTSDLSESIAEMQAKFDVEKAEGAARAQEKQKKIIVVSSVVGGILLLIIILFIWRQSILRKKVNVELNHQKVEIEKKNAALNIANELIEHKNKDITDSIRYARRIQEAILPELEFSTSIGSSGFVLYRPKDIVSGDFYWMKKVGDLILFAAVDCTGHGVPGAFVSLVCSNLLSQAVNEYGLVEPDDILNDVNARLSVTLRQRVDESKVRDGMDIALCSINCKTAELHYAGAFNPAWIARNGQIIELKADKFPVGNFEDEELRKYVRRVIPLEVGDRIYVFSDGYSDQFGGPQGKKYKRKQFVDFIQSIQSSAIHLHGKLLDQEHLAWRGELEQIDDIVVMGVEFPIL